jgi:hypothetical protein
MQGMGVVVDHRTQPMAWSRSLALVGGTLVGLALILAVPALAHAVDEEVPGQSYPVESLAAGTESDQALVAQLTDREAAEGLPLQDLDRTEAKLLLESVFGQLLATSAGPFGDFEVEQFLSDNVALVTPEPANGVTIGGEDAAEEEAVNADGPLLMDSTLPIRTEDDSGNEAVVDLDLERSENELQAVNPLIDISIPDELGEGVSIPSASIKVATSESAEGRVPSILEGNVAFYPNVAKDTDFAVATTPTGIETFTQIRSAEAPQSQTLNLDLVDDAELEATDDGGAVAKLGEVEIIEVMPPFAIDANGQDVPVDLDVVDNAMTLTVAIDVGTTFPVLIDPVIVESWAWHQFNATTGMDGWNGSGEGTWRSARNTFSYDTDNRIPWTSPPSPLTWDQAGLTITSGWYWPATPVVVGSQANWNYYVPRYFSDYEQYGVRPTSFIQNMSMTNLQFATYSSQPSPWIAAGIWDEQQAKWVSVYTRNGYEGSISGQYWNFNYNFPNPQNVQSAKNAGASLISTEAGANNSRIFYIGYAAVSLNDLVNPNISEFAGPGKWVDKASAPVKATAGDSGLGVKKMTLEYAFPDGQGISSSSVSCTGTAASSCPRSKAFNLSGYEPSEMAQGINYVKVFAEDVIGNKSSTAQVQVKVDHTAPSLSLSGTMTKQATLGTSLPQYTLHLDGTDGNTSEPQSGIVSSKITVDGLQVDSTSAGCSTDNCALSRDWVLNADSYAPGPHAVVATVTDGVGLATTKSLTINITQDTTAPVLQTSGNLRTAPEGWVDQVNKSLIATAQDAGGYGVTSLSFTIDGKVVKSVSQACEKGGCTRFLFPTVDMAGYEGGAHSAEVVAKDGAGNTAKDSWTINVNPEGNVSATEAAHTLEAVDTTSDSTAVAPTADVIEPAEVKAGNNPGLTQESTDVASTGTAVDTEMTTDASEGVTIENAKESFHIEPTAGATGETAIQITNGVAGVSANTSTTVDSVIRPLYDGVMTFRNIRDNAAPQAYSWTVQLHAGQTLEAIDEQSAGIFYSDGTLALTILAETAHDATGKSVPTTLSVSGNVLTLTVAHQSGAFVYPVIAGPSWQTGYETVMVPGPPTKQEEEEEEALANYMITESAVYGEISAPEPVGTGDDYDATASAVRTYRRKFAVQQCSPGFPPVLPVVPECAHWEQEMRGHFFYNMRYAWWKANQAHPSCPHYNDVLHSVSTYFCDFVGPNHQKYGGGYHITAQVFFDVTFAAKIGPLTKNHAMTVRMFGSGGIYPHPDENCICNPST